MPFVEILLSRKTEIKKKKRKKDREGEYTVSFNGFSKKFLIAGTHFFCLV